MTRHGLGGSMTLKNTPSRGSMIVKTGGSMFMKNTPLQGVHVSGKSHWSTVRFLRSTTIRYFFWQFVGE